MFPEIPLGVKQCRRVKAVLSLECFVFQEVFVRHLDDLDFLVCVKRLSICLLAARGQKIMKLIILGCRTKFKKVTAPL